MASDRPIHVVSQFLIYYLLETSSCVIDGNHPTYHKTMEYKPFANAHSTKLTSI